MKVNFDRESKSLPRLSTSWKAFSFCRENLRGKTYNDLAAQARIRARALGKWLSSLLLHFARGPVELDERYYAKMRFGVERILFAEG